MVLAEVSKTAVNAELMESASVLIGSPSLVLIFDQSIRLVEAVLPSSLGGDELYPLEEIELYLVPILGLQK